MPERRVRSQMHRRVAVVLQLDLPSDNRRKPRGCGSGLLRRHPVHWEYSQPSPARLQGTGNWWAHGSPAAGGQVHGEEAATKHWHRIWPRRREAQVGAKAELALELWLSPRLCFFPVRSLHFNEGENFLMQISYC